MDLYAYSQIERLENILKANDIEIPRLRGLRLMSEENPVTEEELRNLINEQKCHVYDKACNSIPRFAPNSWDTDSSWERTERVRKKYLIMSIEKDVSADGSEYEYIRTVGFRWELLHGKARKRLKFAIKNAEKDVRASIEAYNKYVGRNDVMCVHARIGGNNWTYFGAHKSVENQPWFLEKVDDYFDGTYCDIYVKIS